MTEEFEDLSEEELLQRLAQELTPDLKECLPRQGIERFIEKKRPEIAPGTLSTYEQKLSRFLEFCEAREIEDLRELDARTLDDYRTWLRMEGSDEVDEFAGNTMQDELYLFKQCVSYWEDIKAVEPGLSESISIPELDEDEGVRSDHLEADRMSEILEYLATYHYASRDHVILLLLSKGLRTCTVHSLDRTHCHLDQENSYLELRHKPPETRLKNGKKSERQLAIPEADAQVIKDHIENHRPDVTDEQGREPLLASDNGRIAKSTIRRTSYAWTRPCAIGNGCPHDRDPADCGAAQRRNKASECPSVKSPHLLRHGYITECRQRGIPVEILTDRCDVTAEVLEEVYDESSEEDRREMRRRVLDEFVAESGGGYL